MKRTTLRLQEGRISRAEVGVDGVPPYPEGHLLDIAVVRPGTWKASTGPVTITAAHMKAAVEAFLYVLEQSSGTGGAPLYPFLKLTHQSGGDAIIIGKVVDLWIDGEWLMARAVLNDPYTVEQVVYWDTMPYCSMELVFGAEVYGKKFAAYLPAVSVLTGEELPAVPGAGVVRVAAAAAAVVGGSTQVVVMAAATAAPDEKECENMEKDLKDALEALEAKLSARLDKLEGAAKAAEDKAKAAVDAAAGETVKAARAKLDGRAVAGALESVDASLQSLDGPARLAVLAVLDATLPAKLSAGDGREKLSAGTTDTVTPETPATVEAALATVAARDKLTLSRGDDYTTALCRASVEWPGLFNEPEKKE